MKDVTLVVTEDEAKAILQVLGQLPTSSGAFPLLVKIDAQLKQQEPPQEIAN